MGNQATLSETKAGETWTGEVAVQAVAPVREVGTARGMSRVEDLLVSDGNGTARLSVWGEQVGQFHKGDHIALENCFVGTYKEGRTLVLGTFGSATKAKPATTKS
jgi:ssDNA-binding replication factor A large subunit